MILTWKELQRLGVTWEAFCEWSGCNEYALKEGLFDDDSKVELTDKDFTVLNLEILRHGAKSEVKK